MSDPIEIAQNHQSKSQQPSILQFFTPVDKQQFRNHLNGEAAKDTSQRRIRGLPPVAPSTQISKKQRQKVLQMPNTEQQRRCRKRKRAKEIEDGIRDSITGKLIKKLPLVPGLSLDSSPSMPHASNSARRMLRKNGHPRKLKSQSRTKWCSGTLQFSGQRLMKLQRSHNFKRDRL
jgi:hypothetical protein